MLGVKRLFPGKSRVAGLDIGSSLLKLIELEDTPDGWSLRCFAQLALDRGIIGGGLINDHDALTRKIKELFKVSRYRGKNVVTALSGHTVIIKKASFSRMEEDQLRSLIIDEAGEYLPFDDIRDVNFDFHICREQEEDPSRMDVVIAAAKKEVSEGYVYAIEKAGAKVMVMDVDSFALETAYEENYDFDADDIVALVNIGASITNINIVRDGESVFTRNIMLGGDSVTEALKNKLDISFEEAEMIKIEASTGEKKGEENILDYFEPILQEIGRSFDYFSSTVGGFSISRIFLSGGCARNQDIAHTMGDIFQCETEIFNPFKNILCDEKTFSPSYLREIGPTAALAVGLALRREEETW